MKHFFLGRKKKLHSELKNLPFDQPSVNSLHCKIKLWAGPCRSEETARAVLAPLESRLKHAAVTVQERQERPLSR